MAELPPGLLVAVLTHGSCSLSQRPCLCPVISFSKDFPFHAQLFGNDRISFSLGARTDWVAIKTPFSVPNPRALFYKDCEEVWDFACLFVFNLFTYFWGVGSGRNRGGLFLLRYLSASSADRAPL